MYQPLKNNLQMNTPAKYQTCTITEINGKDKKTYSDAFEIFGYYKEKSGSEYEVNGLNVVNKTITFTCWYDPRIEQNGRLIIYGKTYEITNAENVEMRNKYMVCSLSYVGAGA